ncbi:MAG: hypothetical protein M3133_11570 [Actinomycetota bacterium]|nr:hypothetical protein [Actinomycetota bacterium]
MKRLSLAGVALALVLITLTPLPALGSHNSSPESSPESLNCTAVLDVAFEPGLSITPSKGTFKTVKPGAVECVGMLQGQQLTGPGSLSLAGNYGQSSDAGDTCTLVLGTGTYALRLPTRPGAVSETGRFAEVLGPTREGSFSAVSEDRKWGGSFDFSPTQGDCLLAPITAAQITLKFEAGGGGQPDSTVGLSGGSGRVAPGLDEGIASDHVTSPVELQPVFGLSLLSHLAIDLTSIVGDHHAGN